MKKLNKLIKLAALTFLVLSSTTMCQMAGAMEEPKSVARDSRLKVVEFQKDNVVTVRATTFAAIQIVFSIDEIIENVEIGDKDAWLGDKHNIIPNVFFLKPTILGSDSNMTIDTNKHTYYFHLISNKVPPTTSDNSIYAIRFTYPDEEKSAALAKIQHDQDNKQIFMSAKTNPEDYNWDYAFSGSKRIVPTHIFDDGQFTYLELQPGQDVPAVFAVDNSKGEESVINFRREGHYIVIQQVSPQYTLRDGKNIVATIFNNKLIAKLKLDGEA